MSRKSSKANFFARVNQDFLFENRFLIAGLILGLVLLAVGVFQLISSSASSNQIEIVSPNQNGLQQAADQTSEIIVDVAGAVVKPGVYSLTSGARLQEAILVAGNFSVKADLAWVAKNLNLAAKLQDGGKIYIPQKGEVTAVSTQQAQVITNSAKVNINSATQAQLEALPAIGPVTAGKIIAARPYNSVEELLTKKVVGKSTFGKIKDLVSVF